MICHDACGSEQVPAPVPRGPCVTSHFPKMSRQVTLEMISLGQRTLCRIHFSVPAVQDAPKKKTKKPMMLSLKKMRSDVLKCCLWRFFMINFSDSDSMIQVD